MFNHIHPFLEAIQPMRCAVQAFAESTGACRFAMPDHFCYKCGSTAEFEHLRSMLEQHTRFSYTSFVSRRRIALLAFIDPVETGIGLTRYLELSDQKPDGSQKSGFDHVEIMASKGFGYAQVLQKLQRKDIVFTESGNPHHPTHDTNLEGKFKIRLTHGRLLDTVIGEMRKADEED